MQTKQLNINELIGYLFEQSIQFVSHKSNLFFHEEEKEKQIQLNTKMKENWVKYYVNMKANRQHEKNVKENLNIE